MSHICPLCGCTTGAYAEIDQCQTFVGGIVSIRFWLCHGCSQATAFNPEVLDNLPHGEFSRLYEYFKTREYTLCKEKRRTTIQKSPLLGEKHV
jgi:hypothetical protein